jgi:hypothetical protein
MCFCKPSACDENINNKIFMSKKILRIFWYLRDKTGRVTVTQEQDITKCTNLEGVE